MVASANEASSYSLLIRSKYCFIDLEALNMIVPLADAHHLARSMMCISLGKLIGDHI